MGDIYQRLDADDLVTGEAVTLDLPPASLGVRLLSGLIDLAFEALLLLAGILLTVALASDEALASVGIIVSLVAAWVVVPTTIETLTRGKSLGKLALGTRTVRDDAGPISLRHALIRSLVGVVEIWVFSGVPAMVCALVSPKGQRVGDYVAGTYVIRDKVQLRLTPPVAMPPQLAHWAARADISPLPEGLAIAIRQLLGRSDTLAPQARDRLLVDVAQRAVAYVAPPPPTGTPPYAFLAAVQAERRDRDTRRLAQEADLRRRLSRRR
ncbi:MAG: domain containing protein [Nocardioidaceae bacterium]|nr:domain containing protein [Nocardioidaceae bacterium]